MIKIEESNKYLQFDFNLAKILFCILIAILSIQPVMAEEYEDFSDCKKRELKVFEKRISQIRSSHDKDESLLDFDYRLKLVDQVTDLLVQRFESSRSESFDNILGDIMGPQGEMDLGPSNKMFISAPQILSQYQQPFSEPISIPEVNKDDLKFMCEYYDSAVKVASQYISRRGKVIAAIDANCEIEMLELCLIMPFLHTPDSQWTLEQIALLPDWMKTSSNLKRLEIFSLEVLRPNTAFNFAVLNSRKLKKKSIKSPDNFSTYLLKAAEVMIKRRNYHVAVNCIRVGITEAQKEGRDKTAIELYFKLARQLTSIGHPQMAAKDLLQLMNTYPKRANWGKAAVLRLKNLYEIEEYQTIISESGNYQADPRCKEYLAQVYYISWVANRRVNNSENADKMMKIFLQEYPNHPLGADMHFASAMSAMSAGDYSKAAQTLEMIEYNYPSSRVKKKVKKIRQKLEKTILNKS